MRRLQRKARSGSANNGRNERRIEILAAAAKAFMTSGYAATSIDTVADTLGSTKGLIYYHFKDKADLFFAIHEHSIGKALAEVAPIAAADATPTSRLWKMAFSHAMLIITDNSFQRTSVLGLEMHVSGSTTPEQRQRIRSLTALRDKYERVFCDVIEAGIAAGEFRACSPRLVVKPLLGALNWMALWYRPQPRETEEERRYLAETMADFVVGGVASRSTAANAG